MFEKRPIWGIIVGLNVCVLIWLISVQEPVTMYDASSVIISSNLQQQENVAIAAGLVGGGGGGGTRDLVLNSNVPLVSRGARDDRDVSDDRYEPPQHRAQYATYSSNDVTSTNASGSSSMSKLKRPLNVASMHLKTTTDAVNLSGPGGGGIHSLTSSLGTGIIDAKIKPTPSWKKLTAISSALPSEDFNRLIDLQHFHYVVPQPVCTTDIQALILVHSAPKNYEKRQIIRDTWASIGRHSIDTPLRVLFLLGAVEDTQVQDALLQENNQYTDIIQGSFADDYRNMTYKHVMAFKWFLYNCPEAQILIKVDDDVYVNTPQLLQYLREEQQWRRRTSQQNYENPTSNTTTNTTTATTMTTTITTTKVTKSTKSKSLLESLGIFTNRFTSDTKEASSSSSSSSSSSAALPFNASGELFHRPQNLLFCQKIVGSMVKRSYRSKWRVGFKEYTGRYYPPYCPGYAIIYSPDVVFRLYTAAQQSKYFWIDDVHITGVLAQQTNTTITTSSHYVLYSDECDRLLTGKTDLNDVEFLFAWHSITARQIQALWHLQMMAQHQREDDDDDDTDTATVPLSSAALSSSSASSSSSVLPVMRQHFSKDERLSYNISNYLTLEGGFR